MLVGNLQGCECWRYSTTIHVTETAASAPEVVFPSRNLWTSTTTIHISSRVHHFQHLVRILYLKILCRNANPACLDLQSLVRLRGRMNVSLNRVHGTGTCMHMPSIVPRNPSLTCKDIMFAHHSSILLVSTNQSSHAAAIPVDPWSSRSQSSAPECFAAT